MSTLFNKLENPERVSELAMPTTLQRLGLGGNMVFCDVGAGTGLFTFAAVQITKGTIYAVEISLEMLDILHKKLVENPADQVIIESDITHVPASSSDLLLFFYRHA